MSVAKMPGSNIGRMHTKACKKRIFVFLPVLFLLVSACAKPPATLTAIAPDRVPASSSVGVAWLTPCGWFAGCKKEDAKSNQAKFIPFGANGLLILGAVMSAHQDVIDGLEQVSADDIVTDQFLSPIGSALKSQGFSVNAKSKSGYAGAYERIDGKAITLTEKLKELYPERGRLPGSDIVNETQRDITSIANELSSDYLVILEINRFGVQRDFGPVGIPLGRPYALSIVRTYLVDVSSNEILFNDYGIGEVKIPEGWRQPDDWTLVNDATKKSLEIALERTTRSLASAVGTLN